jgi:hypothetical protein
MTAIARKSSLDPTRIRRLACLRRDPGVSRVRESTAAGRSVAADARDAASLEQLGARDEEGARSLVHRRHDRRRHGTA